ncbi:KRR1 small subunit processome component-like [Pyrus communis]|uniref:KRR1 small subunit processome component-like n=1 Tax=Pyrus communis TaxID=23211 RepID=UPI0035C0FFA9
MKTEQLREIEKVYPSSNFFSFSAHFPKDKEKYVQEAWPMVKSALEFYDISCSLDLVEGSMTISALRWHVSEVIFIQARIVLFLFSTSTVSAPEELFPELKAFLVGPNCSYLKALQELTSCFVVVHDDVVFAKGSFNGLRIVRMVVEDCFVYKVSAESLIARVTKEGGLHGWNAMNGIRDLHI